MRNILLSYLFLTAVGFLLCLVAKALESDPARVQTEAEEGP